MADNGVDEVDIKRYELGPGIKHAIIWLSIITSFAGGWYTRGEMVEGELARADLIQLQDDIVEKAKSIAKRDKNQRELDEELEGKKYDKDCGNMSIIDFYE